MLWKKVFNVLVVYLRKMHKVKILSTSQEIGWKEHVQNDVLLSSGGR